MSPEMYLACELNGIYSKTNESAYKSDVYSLGLTIVKLALSLDNNTFLSLKKIKLFMILT